MSENETKESETNALQEVTNKVAISVEDCTGAADFWPHFDIPMPADLKEAFEAFSKEQTFENQCKIKLAICKAIGYTEHEAFADEMFKEIVEECRNVTYDMGFDKALESTLGVSDITSNDKQ